MTSMARILTCLIVAIAPGMAADPELAARGKAEEARSCVQCHSMRLTHSQRLSKAGWIKEVDKMIGWGAPVKDRQAIIDYLSEECSDSKPLPQPDRSGNGAEKKQTGPKSAGSSS